MTYTCGSKGMTKETAGIWPAKALMLAGIALTAACSKPAPDPAIPAKVVAGTSLWADPNPITSDGSGLGETTVAWSTNAAHVELRIGSAGGRMFGSGGQKGKAVTDKWVTNGMTFYLQNMDAPDPSSPEATLGVLSVTVQ